MKEGISVITRSAIDALIEQLQTKQHLYTWAQERHPPGSPISQQLALEARNTAAEDLKRACYTLIDRSAPPKSCRSLSLRVQWGLTGLWHSRATVLLRSIRQLWSRR
jgi:hypothetical protein